MRSITQRSSKVVAGAAVVGLLTSLATVPAAARDEPLLGFTAGHSAAQRRAEKDFLAAIDPAQAKELNTTMSSRPQLIGTEGNRVAGEYALGKLREWGLPARHVRYSVYGSVAKDIKVEVTAPTKRTLSVKEKPYPGQKYLDEAVVGYNAYSPAGDVTGQVVYVNYGLPEDYQHLASLGVDVRGKIVLARYGGSFRGVKSKVAQEHGAKGVIIYSDPKDDGFVRGPVYPDGPWRPADSIQRGSVQYIFEYPGDPLTPGEPSVPGTERIDPEDADNLPRIPTTPISYGEAQHLLRALGGPAVPANWQGGLDFPYHVGPGPTEARLDLDIEYQQLPVDNIITEIKGRGRPDEKVIIGAHRDAWTYGSVDNTSGWTSALQIAYGISRLLKTGWRPERTIVIAGWDGEEYGLLGSTEWVEQLAPELRRGAVAYLNMDGTAGRSFGASSVPALDDVITDVTKVVPDPEKGTVYANWTAQGAPVPTRLGSGSDYTAFLDRLGVPSADLGFDSPGGNYHSTIDDPQNLERFVDPGSRYQSVSAQTTGLVGLRLAQADVIPLNYSDYARETLTYLAAAGKRGVDVTAATKAAQDWLRATEKLESTRDKLLRDKSFGGRDGLDRLNRSVLAQERALTRSEGLPDRAWYRHQIYAPGTYTGYAVKVLPGVNEPLDQNDTATATQWLKLLTKSLESATRSADC
ncbi:M28 family peptidase [Actinokineospora auranticolor]|uniref:N-acetylated-alpha-linked acidic dipeptidase n=1 Tax=Actinokineospora auranticolor TaxID=155976 RepID=A0A2S6GTN2_9PSEU|nr:M28 family peptidase [Actinokineospora auranticolor]PPK68549.1 N-acetylated-alpha-linked acidic dipeptidase [Actinokineospora auranticolor]